MTNSQHDVVRTQVRNSYAQIALGADGGSVGCCGTAGQGCSAGQLGYSSEELAGVPEKANLGLGCGNPQALAALEPDQVVLDLGSGGGLDCFVAAKQVGSKGQVIGVDMTPEMVDLARTNARRGRIENVDFRLGEIEQLPVADATVDVILSNCVINLSPNKPQVFAEAFRVLKRGGRLALSDVLATAPLPPKLQTSVAALSGCISGAVEASALVAMLEQAGFEKVQLQLNEKSRAMIRDWMPGSGAEHYLVSASIQAQRPQAGTDQ